MLREDILAVGDILDQKQTGLLAGSAAFFFTSLFIYFARFATSVIVARTLGVEGKGTYTLVLMLGALLVLFLSFGLNGSITYLTARHLFTPKEINSFSILSSLLISIVGGFLFYYAYIYFLSGSFLAGTNAVEILLVILILPVNLATLFLSSILLGEQQIIAYSSINLLRVVSNLGFQIVSSLLNGGVIGAILAWLVSNIIAFCATIWILRKQFALKILFPRRVIRPAFSFGIKNYLANLFTFFNYRLDSFLVNYFSGLSSVGLYSVGVSTAELIWYIPNAISSALFPKSSTLEKDVAARLTAQTCRQTIFVTAPLTVLLALMSPYLIPLIYGQAFSASVAPFLWLLPGILFVSLSKIISANLSGMGKPQYATYTSGITIIMTIALDIALIPSLGIVGAAIASSSAYMASALLSLVWFSRETNTPWIDVILPRQNDITILIQRAILIASRLRNR